MQDFRSSNAATLDEQPDADNDAWLPGIPDYVTARDAELLQPDTDDGTSLPEIPDYMTARDAELLQPDTDDGVWLPEIPADLVARDAAWAAAIDAGLAPYGGSDGGGDGFVCDGHGFVGADELPEVTPEAEAALELLALKVDTAPLVVVPEVGEPYEVVRDRTGRWVPTVDGVAPGVVLAELLARFTTRRPTTPPPTPATTRRDACAGSAVHGRNAAPAETTESTTTATTATGVAGAAGARAGGSSGTDAAESAAGVADMAAAAAIGVASAAGAPDMAALAGVSDLELGEVAAGCQRLMSWARGVQAAAVTELSRRPSMRPRASGRAYRSVSGQACAALELTVAMQLTRPQAETLVGESVQLVEDFPATHAALSAGRIDERRARVVLGELGRQDRAVASTVEAAVIDEAAELDPRQLRRKITRLVHELAPVQAEERRRRAEEDRFVRIEPAEDGMAWFQAKLRAEDAMAWEVVLTAGQLALKRRDAAAGDPHARTTDQRRADVMAQLAWAGLATGHIGAGPTVPCTCPHRDTTSTSSTGNTGAADANTAGAGAADGAKAGTAGTSSTDASAAGVGAADASAGGASASTATAGATNTDATGEDASAASADSTATDAADATAASAGSTGTGAADTRTTDTGDADGAGSGSTSTDAPDATTGSTGVGASGAVADADMDTGNIGAATSTGGNGGGTGVAVASGAHPAAATAARESSTGRGAPGDSSPGDRNRYGPDSNSPSGGNGLGDRSDPGDHGDGGGVDHDHDSPGCPQHHDHGPDHDPDREHEHGHGHGHDDGPGGAPPADADAAGGGLVLERVRGRPVTVHVTVPLTTLLGLDQRPGELAGYGPIPADIARHLSAAGVWQWVGTHPVTGAVLSHGRTRYIPTRELIDHIVLRDQQCQTPGCAIPAERVDIDHTLAYPQGGTDANNLGPFCRRDHLVKHHSQFQLTQPEPGVFHWTSPTGRVVTLGPTPVGPTEPVVPCTAQSGAVDCGTTESNAGGSGTGRPSAIESTVAKPSPRAGAPIAPEDDPPPF